MNKETLISSLLVAAGLGLAGSGVFSLKSAEQLRHHRNPFAIQQSAYGKLFARLSETTVDRVWHLGVEQIVPHYMSGLEHGEEEEENEAEATAALLDGTPPPVDPNDLTRPENEELVKASEHRARLELGKRWIQDRVVAQHTRTNPNGLNQQHLNTVYKEIEELLLRSFKMDPTHYGAYDSYHLFLTTTNLGGSPGKAKQARLIAQVAMSAARHESEDPEPWLTAAAAGMNLYLMDAAPYMEKGESIPLDILKKYRDQIGFCLSRFDEVQTKSERAGIWDNLSMDRQMEIAERSRFASRTFKQFDVMIARAESRGTSVTPEGEIADTTATDAE
jgi:hypothetical protein